MRGWLSEGVPLQVDHVEPWEKNSRKLAGQVGMCGGVSLYMCVRLFMCDCLRVAIVCKCPRILSLWNRYSEASHTRNLGCCAGALISLSLPPSLSSSPPKPQHVAWLCITSVASSHPRTHILEQGRERQCVVAIG